ncbi:hypothetical protein BT63DRAFT_447565 [Microthyrium microscopicum]|uniref:F-box domain-containing protein n=1 Tax=Microthyrium microscopicum TaxID=703497 RepID=A0A6A6UA53_9PEZI|nr:hypothetical protein BT63DRAFT_447565 [Microthyrium microscopicum]
MGQQLFLLDLPKDILITLPDYLHDIEDYKNLTSTCRAFRACLSSPSDKTILRLAAAATNIFFRPSPHFLVTAVARQLGNWARLSTSNEQVLAQAFQSGIEAVLDLALQHCSLSMERIRQLHKLRFSIINPVTNRIDQCIGEQWYATPNFWHGGVDDAYTIDADVPETFFYLAMYGEFFAPDADILLGTGNTDADRALSVETRLEFVKYCIPDIDPLRRVYATGPYIGFDKPKQGTNVSSNHIGLRHLLESSRWRPDWTLVRQSVGPDFGPDDSDDENEDDLDSLPWKQFLWSEIAVCQGLEGLGMMLNTDAGDFRVELYALRDRIEALEREPERVVVGRNHTYRLPSLYRDLGICSSGYVGGT